MTQHEKKFLIRGLTLGLMLALVAYATMRLWHPDRSAAQSQEAPILKYEATPDQTNSELLHCGVWENDSSSYTMGEPPTSSRRSLSPTTPSSRS